MKDSFGRDIDYLRLSITDRCNLRCVYCMPEEGIQMATHMDVLRFDEILHVCRIMADMGVRKIKVTGGEPLARKGAASLIRELKAIEGIEKVTLTTNGVELAKQIDALHEAGVDGINISLDTLDQEVFHKITRRDMLHKVMEGIESVLQYPDIPLKINCVPLGDKKQDLVKLAGLAKDKMLHVRFIEMMPIGFGKDFHFLSQEDICRSLEEVYGPMTPYKKCLGNGPCQYYELEGFKGKIGFISAISHKFCDECNRVRLTSQGYLKTCLQYDMGRDLRAALREGASDEHLRRLIEEAIACKPKAHRFLEEAISEENSMGMSQIGG